MSMIVSIECGNEGLKPGSALNVRQFSNRLPMYDMQLDKKDSSSTLQVIVLSRKR